MLQGGEEERCVSLIRERAVLHCESRPVSTVRLWQVKGA